MTAGAVPELTGAVELDGGPVGVEALCVVLDLVVVGRVVDCVPERRPLELLNVPVEVVGVGVGLLVTTPELTKPVLNADAPEVPLEATTVGGLPEDGTRPELAPPVLNAVPPEVTLEAKGVGTRTGPDDTILLPVTTPEAAKSVLKAVLPLLTLADGSAGADVETAPEAPPPVEPASPPLLEMTVTVEKIEVEALPVMIPALLDVMLPLEPPPELPPLPPPPVSML